MNEKNHKIERKICKPFKSFSPKIATSPLCAKQNNAPRLPKKLFEESALQLNGVSLFKASISLWMLPVLIISTWSLDVWTADIAFVPIGWQSEHKLFLFSKLPCSGSLAPGIHDDSKNLPNKREWLQSFCGRNPISLPAFMNANDAKWIQIHLITFFLFQKEIVWI